MGLDTLDGLREENAQLSGLLSEIDTRYGVLKLEVARLREENARLACAAAGLKQCCEEQRAENARLLERVDHVEGAMRADDKRLEDAAVEVWGEHRWGCDTPDVMAETILSLRERVAELERDVAQGEGVARGYMLAAETAEAKLARCVEALEQCVYKRRGDVSLAASMMADAEVMDEDPKDYMRRCDRVSRAALAAAKGE